MKYIAILSILLFLLSIGIVTSANMDKLFSLDLSNRLFQFTNFSDSPSDAQVVTDEDSNAKVIQFTRNETTKASGIVTSGIKSLSGNYWIVIEFKGNLNAETGAYLGYVHNNSITQQNVQISQFVKFKSNGSWNSYKTYLQLGQGDSIKIILGSISYFRCNEVGVDCISVAMFKGLTVYDFTVSDECSNEDQTYKLNYYKFLFYFNELESNIFIDQELLAESNYTKGKVGFKLLNSGVSCIKYACYGLTSDGSANEAFQPTYEENVNFE